MGVVLDVSFPFEVKGTHCLKLAVWQTSYSFGYVKIFAEEFDQLPRPAKRGQIILVKETRGFRREKWDQVDLEAVLPKEFNKFREVLLVSAHMCYPCEIRGDSLPVDHGSLENGEIPLDGDLSDRISDLWEKFCVYSKEKNYVKVDPLKYATPLTCNEANRVTEKKEKTFDLRTALIVALWFSPTKDQIVIEVFDNSGGELTQPPNDYKIFRKMDFHSDKIPTAFVKIPNESGPYFYMDEVRPFYSVTMKKLNFVDGMLTLVDTDRASAAGYMGLSTMTDKCTITQKLIEIYKIALKKLPN